MGAQSAFVPYRRDTSRFPESPYRQLRDCPASELLAPDGAYRSCHATPARDSPSLGHNPVSTGELSGEPPVRHTQLLSGWPGPRLTFLMQRSARVGEL